MKKQLAATGRPFYEQIADMVKYSLELNIDETSWSEGPLIKWLWTFVARSQVLFKIASSRSGEVLRDVLGPVYNGVLGSDCFTNSLDLMINLASGTDPDKIKSLLFTPNTS